MPTKFPKSFHVFLEEENIKMTDQMHDILIELIPNIVKAAKKVKKEINGILTSPKITFYDPYLKKNKTIRFIVMNSPEERDQFFYKDNMIYINVFRISDKYINEITFRMLMIHEFGVHSIDPTKNSTDDYWSSEREINAYIGEMTNLILHLAKTTKNKPLLKTLLDDTIAYLDDPSNINHGILDIPRFEYIYNKMSKHKYLIDSLIKKTIKEII